MNTPLRLHLLLRLSQNNTMTCEMDSVRRFLSTAIRTGILALSLFLPLTTYATTTSITTSIPKQVSISIEMSGNGTVAINNQSIKQSALLFVDRHEDIKIDFNADTGYVLTAVYLDKINITDRVKNNVLIIENIQFDAVLSVVFTKESIHSPGTNPSTGDSCFLYFSIVCCIVTGIMIIATFRSYQRHNNHKKRRA